MCGCGGPKYNKKPAVATPFNGVVPATNVIGGGAKVTSPIATPKTPVITSNPIDVQRTTGYVLPPSGGAANDPVQGS